MKEPGKLEKLLRSSRWFVFTYMAWYAVMTLLQTLPAILKAIWGITFNDTFTIPMDIWGWGLTFVIAFYAGIDRAALISRTAHMEIGKKDMGNPGRLRTMIYITMVLLIETYALAFFFKVDLPLEAITTAYISMVLLYTGGNKGIDLASAIDKTKDNQPWANENNATLVDEDGDGVDDHLEKPCANATTCEHYKAPDSPDTATASSETSSDK